MAALLNAEAAAVAGAAASRRHRSPHLPKVLPLVHDAGLRLAHGQRVVGERQLRLGAPQLVDLQRHGFAGLCARAEREGMDGGEVDCRRARAMSRDSTRARRATVRAAARWARSGCDRGFALTTGVLARVRARRLTVVLWLGAGQDDCGADGKRRGGRGESAVRRHAKPNSSARRGMSRRASGARCLGRRHARERAGYCAASTRRRCAEVRRREATNDRENRSVAVRSGSPQGRVIAECAPGSRGVRP